MNRNWNYWREGEGKEGGFNPKTHHGSEYGNAYLFYKIIPGKRARYHESKLAVFSKNLSH